MSSAKNHHDPSQNQTQGRRAAIPRRPRVYAIGVALILSLSMALAYTAVADEHDAPDAPFTFSPESGPAGTYVWLTGTDFTRDDTVYLGGIEVEHDYYGQERIGFTIPSIGPAEYLIAVVDGDRNVSVCCFDLTSGDDDEADEPEASPSPASSPTDNGGATGSQGSLSGSCREPGLNVECTEFGTIKMKSQEDIKGKPVTVGAEIWLNDNYEDQNARHLMFSIRHDSKGGSSPVVIELVHFKTDAGEIVTSKVDHTKPNELNLWVDVLDTPVKTDIHLEVEVGVTERGAFVLETVVIPFDRGYDPIPADDGEDTTLYSYTLLGVNEETSGNLGSGRFGALPAPGVGLIVGTLAIAAIALTRSRRDAL